MTTGNPMLRVTLALGCLLASAAIFVGAQVGVGANGRPFPGQKAFRPYGYFSLVGKPPRGFENVDLKTSTPFNTGAERLSRQGLTSQTACRA